MSFDFEDRCCEEDFGGSHYHCANCGKVSGMYGHISGDNFTCQYEKNVWTEKLQERKNKLFEGWGV